MKAALDRRLRELVAIPGASGHEEKVREFLEQELIRLGLTCWKDDAGNLYGRLSGRGEPVLLCAHMDTVELALGAVPVLGPDQVYRPQGQTALGGDDRAGIAIILQVLEEAAKTSPHPAVEVFFTVEEERGLLGSRRASLEGLTAGVALVLDSSRQPGFAVLGAPYKAGIAIAFQGRSAHAALALGDGISAILMAADALSAMGKIPLKDGLVWNAGSVRAEGATNVVCSRAMVLAEARCHDKGTLDGLLEQLDSCCQTAAQTRGGHVEFHAELDYAGYRIAPEHPAVRRLERACRHAGTPFVSGLGMGGTAGTNRYGKGIVPLCLGIGAKHPHSLEECLAAEDLLSAARIALEYLKDMGGYHAL